jgi:hypothetical protein
MALGFPWTALRAESSKGAPSICDARADIGVVQSFDEIRSELSRADQNTLVVFDVDDVLITYEDMVLRPCGARFRPSSWEGIDPKEIPYLMSIMLSSSKTILVEPFLPQLIKTLQLRGVKTMALTAARTGKFGVIDNAEDWRVAVLKGFGIDFSVSFPQGKVIFFDQGGRKESEYSLFKEGILFLGNESMTKGKLLVQFLKTSGLTPEKIIFIDDKMAHLISVETEVNAAKIPFQGYQYKGVEQLSGTFDASVAQTQFACLRKYHKWVSDEEAKKNRSSSSN